MGTFFTDTSYYQNAVNYSYARPWISFRIADGSFTDPLFATNYAWCKRQPASKLVGIIGYYVFRPGLSALDQYHKIVGVVGAPDKRFVVMIDVESWGGAIGGDHSDQINELASLLAQWLGSTDRVLIYGNQGDLARIYPRRNAIIRWLRRNQAFKLVVASYGSQMPALPNQVAWQYSDGDERWPVPHGWPRATAPFGNCDHNYSPLEPLALAKALGVAQPAPKPLPKPLSNPAVELEEEEDVYIRFVNSGPKNNSNAVYLVSGGTLVHIDALTYGWLGAPKVHSMDHRSTFWNLPVVPGTPDYRGK